MPTFEDFYQNLQGLSGAAGGAAGNYAAGEMVVKPALQKKREQEMLDRALFNGDFATAAAIAKKMGLADDTWDYQAAEREVPTQTPLPITTGPVSSLPTNPTAAGVPQPATPMPLSDGFFLAALKGQNLATNPLGLKGSAAALPTLTPEAPAAPPMTYQALGTSSLGANPQVDLYDFTPAREIYRTDNLAETGANKARLMAFYGGKVPEAELKTNYNNAILQVRPGYGFTPPSVTELAPGGIPDNVKVDLALKAARVKQDAEEAAKRLALTQRGQDITVRGQNLDYQAAMIRAARGGASSGMTDRNKIKVIQDILDDGESLVRSRRREIDELGTIMLDERQRAARDAGIVREAAQSMISRAYATGDDEIISRVQAAVSSISAAGGSSPTPPATPPAATPPAATPPAKPGRPLPPSPGPVGAPVVPAQPRPTRAPAAAPAVRPSVMPPTTPPSPVAPQRQPGVKLEPAPARPRPAQTPRTQGAVSKKASDFLNKKLGGGKQGG